LVLSVLELQLMSEIPIKKVTIVLFISLILMVSRFFLADAQRLVYEA